VTANQGGTWTVQQGGAPWTVNPGTAANWGVGATGAAVPANGVLASMSQGGNTTALTGTSGNLNINVAAGSGAVKASGTNAATTDAALVVAPSPNPSTMCTSFIAISQTASTDLVTSTNKLHICAMLIVSATAQSISLVEGTGATCGTGTAAIMGATTAANGMSLAANGGWTHTADRAFLVTATTADHLCLLQSGAGNVSGFISYVDHN